MLLGRCHCPWMHPRQLRLSPFPRRRHVSLRQMGRDIASVLSVPSFVIVVAQGIVGSTPWNALVFNTLYLQLLGMSDFQASLISALFLAGTAVGALVRGGGGGALPAGPAGSGDQPG